MTAVTLTLTEFLLARIAEDEALARQSSDGGPLETWHTRDCGIHPQGLEKTWCDCDVPARVLAECEAKRRIIADHSDHCSPNDPAVCDAHDGKYALDECPTLRALAAVYADHEDYRDEWRP